MRPIARLGALVALAFATSALAPACGARTELPTPAPTPVAVERSAAFCAKADYRSGTTDTSLLLVLDKSGSMTEDGKWDQVTAAVAAFVDSPDNAGLAMGLSFFPLGSSCDVARYAAPAVPMGLLPANAAAMKAALAKQKPDGDTPTRPVLRGAIEYARALALADPSRSVVVALATDGAPNTCDSTTERVAAIARDGATTEPQVLTFVIGVLTGYVSALQQIAQAGGTGAPIFLHDAASSAGEFTAALRYLRETQAACRFAVPDTGSASPSATDLGVEYVLSPGAAAVAIPVVASGADCGARPGFFPDDLGRPTRVTLCPASCEAVHGSSASRVHVVAGCGAGAGDAGVPGNPDGGACSGTVDFACVTECGAATSTLPVCVGGEWFCPSGTLSTDACSSCPPVPHGCCKGDGTFADAACLVGVWTCAPGTTLFGEAGCAPPAVCTRTLPCALGEVCETPDFACGDTTVLGRCVTPAASCADAAPACGCDGALYTSRCAAEASGHDVSIGGCLTPKGTFACGPLFCRRTDEVCKKTADLAKAVGANDFACLPATPACPTGCGCGACLPCPAGRACTEACTTGGNGERFLTCTQL